MTLIQLEQLFQMSNLLALLGWFFLAFSPAGKPWAPRGRWLAGRVLPLIFGLAYVLLLAIHGFGEGGFGSLAEVLQLMSRPSSMTAGWLHYLAFDLFVGAWIAERAGALGIPHWLVLPLLGLTFMLGPAGLLAFALVRFVWLRSHPSLTAA